MADQAYVRRTAVTRLEVDDDQRDLLAATIDDYRRGCQLATDMAWPDTTTKSDVQPLAYDAVRENNSLVGFGSDVLSKITRHESGKGDELTRAHATD